MIEQLFGSKTRVKLLQLFYGNPNRSFYVREITRKIDEQINSVRRELSNLLSIGIISSETNNNKLYYEVNQKFEYYQPLAQIFGGAVVGTSATGVSSSDEVTDETQDLIKALGHVELLLVTGQFTRDESSGIDVLVIGDINQTQLGKYITQLEKEEGKELRYTAMSLREFNYRIQINDKFLSKVLESKKQVIFDRNILDPAGQEHQEVKESEKIKAEDTKSKPKK